MTQTISMQDTLRAIKKLRDEMPEFATDPDVKDLINNYQTILHSLVSHVQQEVGFKSFEQTLKFVDTELEMMGRLA